MVLSAALSAAGVLHAGAQSPTARGVIDGLVTDTNLVSLSGATVSLLGSTIRVTTGAGGRFRILALPPGQYLIVVHRLGYIPISATVYLADGDTLRTSFAMEQVASALDTVVTTAKALIDRLSEFEARRTLGFGTFITQEQIERRNSVYVADLLNGIPSVGISRRKLFTSEAYSTRSGGCPMRVFLDGVLLPLPTNLDDLPSPKEVAGIEIYSGSATIPVQYKTANSGCGVILVWTRGGE